MSDMTFTQALAIPGRGAARSVRILGRLVWLMIARSRERRVLASLDARGLRDIGLTPTEAGREAGKWFWQP